MLKLLNLLHHNLNKKNNDLRIGMDRFFYEEPALLIMKRNRLKGLELTNNLRNLLVDNYHDNQ